MGGVFSADESASREEQKTSDTKITKSGFVPIPDKYETLEEVQDALRAAGLESSNLVIAVDYTKSNEWTGKRTFGGQSLHTVHPQGKNQYQSVIEIMGKTLQAFDDDNLIPVFGFGDASTKNKACFPFYPDRPCRGFEDVLSRYNAITPGIAMSGPTNFAPVIRETINITKTEGGYHILLIIADGQVTDMDDTVRAIVEASNYPISIVMVGVGDGPWDAMEEFDDELPDRKFDNFQFVNFVKVMKENPPTPAAPNAQEVAFAVSALMEIPDQYNFLRKNRMLG